MLAKAAFGCAAVATAFHCLPEKASAESCPSEEKLPISDAALVNLVMHKATSDALSLGYTYEDLNNSGDLQEEVARRLLMADIADHDLYNSIGFFAQKKGPKKYDWRAETDLGAAIVHAALDVNRVRQLKAEF